MHSVGDDVQENERQQPGQDADHKKAQPGIGERAVNRAMEPNHGQGS